MFVTILNLLSAWQLKHVSLNTETLQFIIYIYTILLLVLYKIGQCLLFNTLNQLGVSLRKSSETTLWHSVLVTVLRLLLTISNYCCWSHVKFAYTELKNERFGKFSLLSKAKYGFLILSLRNLATHSKFSLTQFTQFPISPKQPRTTVESGRTEHIRLQWMSFVWC